MKSLGLIGSLLASQLGVTFFDKQLCELCMNCLSDKVFEIRQAATDIATTTICGGQVGRLVHCILVVFLPVLRMHCMTIFFQNMWFFGICCHQSVLNTRGGS